jgi:hypothetical protein
VLDHVSVGVTNIDRSRRFYDAALRPLGLVDPDGHRIEAVCHAPESPMILATE